MEKDTESFKKRGGETDMKAEGKEQERDETE